MKEKIPLTTVVLCPCCEDVVLAEDLGDRFKCDVCQNQFLYEGKPKNEED